LSEPHENTDSTEDAELVTRCQGGDLGAYDELVIRYRSRIHGMILRMVRNDADAWDLSQDAFVKAWKALPKYEGRSSFYTWLYRIAHNVTYDWLRKRKIEGSVEFDETFERTSIDPDSKTSPRKAEQPDEGMERSELRDRLETAIGKLSPDHRAVVLMKDVEGMRYQEIADTLECSLGTVMSRLHYARKKLQADLQNLDRTL